MRHPFIRTVFPIRQFAFYSRARAFMGFYVEEHPQVVIMSKNKFFFT
jgi:hypothetical protein